MSNLRDALRRAERERRARASSTAEPTPVETSEVGTSTTPPPKAELKGLGSPRVSLPEVPPSFLGEIDIFRQGVESAVPGPTRRILMSSATSGEGVTTLSLFVAMSLASRAGRSVCLVDANLNSPRLTRWLGLEGQLGVSDVCLGRGDWSDALRPTDTDGLFVIGVGREGGEPSRLFGGEIGRDMATQLATRFDYVLIDAGRILGQVEATLLAPTVDGTILVVRANRTKREVLAKAESTIRSQGGTVVGSILNRRTFPIPSAVYKRL